LIEQDQKDQAAHIRWQREYERRGWEWHLFSTQLLFCIVMGIVGFGLWITYQQFKRDYTGQARVRKLLAKQSVASNAAADKSASSAAEPGTPELATPSTSSSTIKIGPAGLEMTSQIVGLLVLALSVAFFYFYLKEVYPMREIQRDKATTEAPAKPDQ
jgi:cytoskeletal protein RodZ